LLKRADEREDLILLDSLVITADVVERSDWSSTTMSSMGLPLMPPFALTHSTCSFAPLTSESAGAALSPVRPAEKPTLIGSPVVAPPPPVVFVAAVVSVPPAVVPVLPAVVTAPPEVVVVWAVPLQAAEDGDREEYDEQPHNQILDFIPTSLCSSCPHTLRCPSHL
jgi:hypothetical protein